MNVTARLFLALSLSLTAFACSGDDDDTGVKDGRCTNDDDCAADQFCGDDNICATGTGDACTTDAECGDGMACDTMVTDCGASRCRNVCVAKTCDDVGQCGALVCLDGACATPPMCDAGVCPAPLECNDARVCVEPTVETCATDDDCTSGDVCVGGECGAPVDCVYSSDCPSLDQRCVMQVCRDPCTEDAQCGDERVWTCDTNGECLQACIDDRLCASGFICEGPMNMQICVREECTTDADCPGAMVRCEGAGTGHGRCVEVQACDETIPDSCEPNFECIAGECVELETCRGDRDCPAASYCEDRHCQPADDCATASCGAGFDCIGDRCVPAVCRGPTDCDTNEVCVRGECIAPVDASAVVRVEIVTTSGAVRPGSTYRLRAVAYDANDELVPGVVFSWMSSMTDVATIDASGVATGGSTAGTTDIAASVDTGAMTISSQAVALVNVGASVDFSLVVVSETTGAPVEGATVDCNGTVATTSADGVATFAIAAPRTCSVFAANHDYVTAIGLDADATIRLPTISRSDRSTGMTGAIDFSSVSGDEPVQVSFSGASFAAPLSELTPSALFGGNLFEFTVPVVGTTVQVPAATTASGQVGPLPFTVKDVYHSETRAGRRTAWSFAGLVGIAELGITGGGDLVTNLLPVFQTFLHGTPGAYTSLAPLPRIVDTGDVDNDGDTTEIVPDYSGFAQVPVTPDTAQQLRVQIDGDSSTPPAGSTIVLLVSGVLVPRVGFVPLGLDGLAAGGTVGSFSTKMAPPHRGLEVGAYAVVVAAANTGAGTLTSTMSAQLFVGDELPPEVTLSSWLDAPEATYDDGTRALAPSVAGDVWRARFSSPSGSWVVVGPAATTTFTLPAPPTGMADPTEASSLFVEDLDLGGQSTSAFFDLSLDDEGQSRLISRFSQQVVR